MERRIDVAGREMLMGEEGEEMMSMMSFTSVGDRLLRLRPDVAASAWRAWSAYASELPSSLLTSATSLEVSHDVLSQPVDPTTLTRLYPRRGGLLLISSLVHKLLAERALLDVALEVEEAELDGRGRCLRIYEGCEQGRGEDRG